MIDFRSDTDDESRKGSDSKDREWHKGWDTTTQDADPETDSEPLAIDRSYSEYPETMSDTALRDHIQQARRAERIIADVTGDVPPDLSREGEFLTGERFADRFPGEGGDDPHLLGFMVPSDGRLVVRDSMMTSQDGTLVHEGLHKWQVEAAGEALRPAALNEAIIEHLSRQADPTPEVLFDEGPEGQVKIFVPDLEPSQEYVDDAIQIAELPGVYEDAQGFARELEELVGRDAILELCRTTDHSTFSAQVDEATAPGTWTRILETIEGGPYDADWPTAHHILLFRD